MEKNKEKTNLIEFAKGVLILAAFIYLPAYVGSGLKTFLKTDTIKEQYIFLSLCYLILLTIFLLIFRKTLVEDFKDFKKNGKAYFKKTLKYWGLGFLIMCISNYIINVYINSGNLATNEVLNREALGTTPYITIFAMVIFAPLVEELVFRGGFKKAFNKVIPFAIFTGLIFALAHVSSAYESFSEIFTNWKQLLYIVPYGALGYFFGKAYYETNNIYSTISVHALHNGLSVSLLLIAMLLERFV